MGSLAAPSIAKGFLLDRAMVPEVEQEVWGVIRTGIVGAQRYGRTDVQQRRGARSTEPHRSDVLSRRSLF